MANIKIKRNTSHVTFIDIILCYIMYECTFQKIVTEPNLYVKHFFKIMVAVLCHSENISFLPLGHTI